MHKPFAQTHISGGRYKCVDCHLAVPQSNLRLMSQSTASTRLPHVLHLSLPIHTPSTPAALIAPFANTFHTRLTLLPPSQGTHTIFIRLPSTLAASNCLHLHGLRSLAALLPASFPTHIVPIPFALLPPSSIPTHTASPNPL